MEYRNVILQSLTLYRVSASASRHNVQIKYSGKCNKCCGRTAFSDRSAGEGKGGIALAAGLHRLIGTCFFINENLA